MGKIVFLVLKLCLFFKNSLIKKLCLHTSEVFSEAGSMSILYPQKIVLFYLINVLRKLIFSVCEDRQIFLENRRCTRMLSISIQFLCVCWAYAYNWYAHTKHKRTSCRRMLSMRIQFVHVGSACAYKIFFGFYICKRMLSIRVQIVNACWVYAYNL